MEAVRRRAVPVRADDQPRRGYRLGAHVGEHRVDDEGVRPASRMSGGNAEAIRDPGDGDAVDEVEAQALVSAPASVLYWSALGNSTSIGETTPSGQRPPVLCCRARPAESQSDAVAAWPGLAARYSSMTLRRHSKAVGKADHNPIKGAC